MCESNLLRFLGKMTGYFLLLVFVSYQMYFWTHGKQVIGTAIQGLPTNQEAYRASDKINTHAEDTLFPYNTTLSNMLDLLERKSLLQIEEFLKDKPNPEMDDPQLVDIIHKMIYKPASNGKVKLSHHVRSTKQSDVVLEILNNQESGFFVECGGLDGERSSNTLYLEQKKNWKGLLVEMDPLFFLQLLGKNRNCHAIHACLSPSIYPAKMDFKESSYGTGQLKNDTGKEVLCLPFFSIMQAMGQKVIDYFSLDVEGQEYNVLKTIPFDKLDIRVLSVEYNHVDGGVNTLTKFMSKQGFNVYKQIDYTNPDMTMYTHDLIFVKKDMKIKKN